MIQEKLSELGKLMEKNPTSPAVLSLAAEIKSSCTSAEDKRLVEEFVGARLPKISADIENLHEEATRLQLGEIGDMINISYIAKKYFKKSRAWLSQRINGNNVNGRPCRFTPSELDIFNAALRDMGLRLASVAVKY